MDINNDNPNYIYQVAPFRGYKKGVRPVIAYYTNEIYKPYPLNQRYLVSNYGNVYDTVTGTKQIPTENGRGYKMYAIDSVPMLAHRLVMMTFAPIPDASSLQVNHMNGAKWDNYYNPDYGKTNLEWCTQQENALHASRTGLLAVGDRHPNSVWTEAEVTTICEYMQAGYEPMAIASRIGIPYTDNFCNFCSKIRTGQIHHNISKNYVFPRKIPHNETEVHLICQKIAENEMDYDSIAKWVSEQVGREIEPSFVRSIKNRSAKKWAYVINQYTFPRQHQSRGKIEMMCFLIQKGYTNKQIADYLGVPYDTLMRRTLTGLRTGRLWPEISSKYNLSRVYRKYTGPEVHLICQEWQRGISDQKIAEKLGIPYDEAFRMFLHRLASGQTYTDITSIYFPNR